MFKVKKLKLWAIVTLVFVSAMLVFGCASKRVKEEEFSGYLGKQYYTSMKEVKLPSGAVSLTWLAPDFYSPENQKKYFDQTKFIIDRVVWYPTPKPGSQIKSDVLAEIALYFDENLAKALEEEEKVIIVDKPGPGVIRVSPALTGVEVPIESMKVYEAVPVAAVFAVGSVAAGTRDRIIEVYFECKGTDSLSGEMQVATVRKGIGTEKTLENKRDTLELEHARPVLDQFISDFVANLKVIKAGGLID